MPRRVVSFPAALALPGLPKELEPLPEPALPKAVFAAESAAPMEEPLCADWALPALRKRDQTELLLS